MRLGFGNILCDWVIPVTGNFDAFAGAFEVGEAPVLRFAPVNRKTVAVDKLEYGHG